MKFAGTYTALITPFRNGTFDTVAYRQIVEKQIASGVDGIVPVGTTGESPTLTTEEHTEVIRLAVELAQGSIQVIAGTGSNSTAEAIHLTQEAEKLGANAALLVAPYYNKPSQEGLYQHYREIARSTLLPLLLYSIPGRCGTEIHVDTVVRLAADCPNIVALKEAGGNVERISQLRTKLPASFSLLSGDDSLTLPFLAVGGQGVISVASNVIPQEITQFVKAWNVGKSDVALEFHLKYYSFFKSLFVETNPVPVKYALSLLGISSAEVRLPLCELSKSSQACVRSAMEAIGILSPLPPQ